MLSSRNRARRRSIGLAAALLPLPLALAACGSDEAATATPEPGLTPAQQELVATAAHHYGMYVQEETAALLKGTKAFVAAYQTGRDDRARALYAPTRAHWEAIEPVAE